MYSPIGYYFSEQYLLLLSQVRIAEKKGVRGVILYSDPADYANNRTDVYPDTWWLPSWAIQLSHVRYDLMGDPATPDYSSISKWIYFIVLSCYFDLMPFPNTLDYFIVVTG